MKRLLCLLFGHDWYAMSEVLPDGTRREVFALCRRCFREAMRRLICWLRGRSRLRPTELLQQLASGGPLPEHPREAQWRREAERVVMMDGDTDLITGLRPRFDGAGNCVGVHARSCRYPETACHC